jgi:hemerythrin
MEHMEWSPEMALGIESLDQAHQALLAQMLQLAQANDDALDDGFALLVKHLERDFREEEDLMETIAYPAIQSHREQHARVLGALHVVAPGDHAAAREALGLLPLWFQVHLSTQDAALAMALNLADA